VKEQADMRFHRKSGILYMTFGIFDQYPEVVHAVFTRQDGWSKGPFAGLNVGLNTGDAHAAVLENRAAISKCLGNPNLQFLQQVHGSTIVVSTRAAVAVTIEESTSNQADGAITDMPGKMLTIQVADCQAVMLYDPENKVVANIHAGWRGSIGNIVGKCVDTMKSCFSTNPESLAAAIGPSLGPCCAEFVHYKKEIPEAFHRYKDERDHFNFWRITHDQLTGCGVPSQNIEWPNICTKCNPHLFYSYRNAPETGRFASVIGLSSGETGKTGITRGRR
jgi:polyphenol oxidase